MFNTFCFFRWVFSWWRTSTNIRFSMYLCKYFSIWKTPYMATFFNDDTCLMYILTLCLLNIISSGIFINLVSNLYYWLLLKYLKLGFRYCNSSRLSFSTPNHVSLMIIFCRTVIGSVNWRLDLRSLIHRYLY